MFCFLILWSEIIVKVLLLGGTGAMGESLKSILIEQKHKVYVTSRNSHKAEENVRYLKGDAHDEEFMSDVLKCRYDAIVDFMVYRSDEFKVKADKLLNSTGHYIFTSSSRVYANSSTPITEDTPRLLDVCKDYAYLETDEYALAKAREENVLFNGKQKNWTIIRPYITYNVERLQLGAIEKDIWLYRALHGRSIPLPKDVSLHQTTMTYGEDVAAIIAVLIGNMRAIGESFNLTGTEHMSWSEILKIYVNTIEKEIGVKPEIYMPENSLELSRMMNNTTQVYYDRLYDRVFSNSKLLSVIGSDFSFTSIEDGLKRCLSSFMKAPRWRIQPNWKIDAYINKQNGDFTALEEIEGMHAKFKYLGWYCIPSTMKFLSKVKNVHSKKA